MKTVTCLNCEKEVSDESKHEKETGHTLFNVKTTVISDEQFEKIVAQNVALQKDNADLADENKKLAKKVAEHGHHK